MQNYDTVNSANEIVICTQNLNKMSKPMSHYDWRCYIMNNFGKFLLTVFMIIYVVSPIDACPGPIDDIFVIIITQVLKKGGGQAPGQDLKGI